MLSQVIVGLVSLVAGAVASVVGFGIGSLLTPTLGISLGTKLAVAAVSIPHAMGTALRFLIVRKHINRTVLKQFGIASALGGLTGALLHASASNRMLTIALGVLLISTGLSEWTGFLRRIHPGKAGAWIGGLLSGVFGGLVGNQGGVRSAALLTFDLPPGAFIATATAIGLIVDAARMPVYLVTDWRDLANIPGLIALSAGGVLIGTIAGQRLLRIIPRRLFGSIVAGMVFLLGIYLLLPGNRG